MPQQTMTNRLDPRPCPVCSTPFQPYRTSQFTCSRPCRDKAVRQGLVSPKAAVRELTCRGCGEIFTAMWSGVGRQPSCPSCAVATASERQARKNAARRVGADPARQGKNLRDLLRRRYGISVEQYKKMLASQDGRCAICGDPPDPNGVRATSRLHVDHDHVTNQNRDLLCSRCNQGVGFFRDDPQLLRAAAEYIERHRKGA